MKINNHTVSRSGRYVMPPVFKKLFGTFALLTLPIPVSYALQYFTMSSIYLIYVIYIVISIMYIVSIIYQMLTAFTDPGIIPPQSFFNDRVQQIEANFIKRSDDNYANNIDQPLKNVLLSSVQPNTSLQIKRLDRTHNIPYCQECGICKPIRASHSSRYNCCLLRFDHYCPFIGNDVAMFNHAYFHKMVESIMVYISVQLIYFIFVLIYSIVQAAVCHTGNNKLGQICLFGNSNQLVRLDILIGSIFFAVLAICVLGYFVYSLIGLIKFHHNLLKAGGLTREYIGGYEKNIEMTYQYSLYSVKENKKDVRIQAMNKFRPLHNASSFYNKLDDIIKKNKNIKNFNDLLAELKKDEKFYHEDMQFVLEFTYIYHKMVINDLQDDYKPQFVLESNQNLFQYFISLAKSMAKGLYQIDEQYETPTSQLYKDQQKEYLLNGYLSNFLVFLQPKIPFFTYKGIEQPNPQILKFKFSNIPILCVNSIVTSIISSEISTQMIRTDRQQYEKYRHDHPEEFIEDSNVKRLLAKQKKQSARQNLFNDILPAVVDKRQKKIIVKAMKSKLK